MKNNFTKIPLRQNFRVEEEEREEARQAREDILNSRIKKCENCGALVPTRGGCPVCAYKH